MQALDYMFLLEPNDRETDTDELKAVDSLKMKLNIFSTQVEKLPCEGEPFTHVSDHFGISTIIE